MSWFDVRHWYMDPDPEESTPPRLDRKGRPKLKRPEPGPIGVECWETVEWIEEFQPGASYLARQDVPRIRWFEGPHQVALKGRGGRP